MSAAPQGISRQSSQEWKVLSRSSSAASLEEFEIVDTQPAHEVDPFAEADLSNAGSQVEESAPTADIEEGSEAGSEFEEIVSQAEIAEEDPHSAFQVEDEVESCHSSPSFSCQFFELDETELDSCDGASVQFDEAEERPAAAAEVGCSTRARRHRRGMAPAKVGQFADKIRQRASDGLSEAVCLINALDDRIDHACPHVCHGAIYFKEQVQDDLQSMAEEMRGAFGEEQGSGQHTATTFSHVKDQFRNDFSSIRKDVDSALVCLLGSSGRPSEQDHRQKNSKTAITCSLVSLAVASWLVPVRLARVAATNMAM